MPSRKRKSKGPRGRRKENIRNSHLIVPRDSADVVGASETHLELQPQYRYFDGSEVLSKLESDFERLSESTEFGGPKVSFGTAYRDSKDSFETHLEPHTEIRDIHSREFWTNLENHTEPLTGSTEFDSTKFGTILETHLEPHLEIRDIDCTQFLTTLEIHAEPLLLSTDFSSIKVGTTFETHLEPHAEVRDSHSTQLMTTLENHAEPLPGSTEFGSTKVRTILDTHLEPHIEIRDIDSRDIWSTFESHAKPHSGSIDFDSIKVGTTLETHMESHVVVRDIDSAQFMATLENHAEPLPGSTEFGSIKVGTTLQTYLETHKEVGDIDRTQLMTTLENHVEPLPESTEFGSIKDGTTLQTYLEPHIEVGDIDRTQLMTTLENHAKPLPGSTEFGSMKVGTTLETYLEPHIEVRDIDSTEVMTTLENHVEPLPESTEFGSIKVGTTLETHLEPYIEVRDIDSREVVTALESHAGPLSGSTDFDSIKVMTTLETHLEPHIEVPDIDSTQIVTTLENDPQSGPESGYFDGAEVMNTIETSSEALPEFLEYDGTEVGATFESHADPPLDSLELLASQDFGNISSRFTRNNSSCYESVNNSTSGTDHQALCYGAKKNYGRDSEPSPPSTNDESECTSCRKNVSGRDAESTLQKIEIQTEYGRGQASALPQRPGHGTLGKRVELISNLYPIKFPSGNVYHYDVEIVRLAGSSEPCTARSKKYRCLRTKEKRRVIEWMVEREAIFKGLYPAFDGEKNLITRKPLSTSFPHVFVTDYEEGTTQVRVRVRIKPVKKENTASCAINLDAIRSYFEGQLDSVPAESISALETILRHRLCLTQTPIGRSFFSPPGPGCLNPVTGGLEIWFGCHQSVRIGQWGPNVNLDVSASVFYPGGPLIDYMARFLDTTVDALRASPLLADRDRNRLNRKLKDRKVEATHSKVRRKYTVMGLMSESAHTLLLDVGGPTVAQYFKEKYGIDLEFPHLPCLRVKPREKRVYLPVELCNLVSCQHYNRELTRAQMSEMVKYTCYPPKQRFQKITDIREGCFEKDRWAREFGLEVSRDPLQVEGRTLDSPSLIYGSDLKIRPQDDSWNMRGIQFLKGASVHSWALLAFRSIRKGALEKFGKLLKQTGRKLGLKISDPDYTVYVDRMDDVKKLLFQMKEGRGRDLVVVVVPQRNEEAIYREIKKSAETTIGLITQCIREKNVLRITNSDSRCADQLLANLFLKINAKVEGVNYSLMLSEIPSTLWKPVIVMGADVNHPGCYRGLKESLAACSGSLDARCSIYAVRTMPQKSVDNRKGSTEIISDLQSMSKDLLRAFYRHTRQKPEKIIFYRDGVSEGEFLKVQNQEVRSLRRACKDLGEDYEPGITFIVVQKRHHVRFMTKETKSNVPKGTVIDEGVTHLKNFDFFLFSQNSRKGTARPAHYTVLADDNGFTADDLQKLTNQLCYCNVRCTKSVSIPAPVAYAHLAAYRARQYLNADRDGSESSGLGSSHIPTTLEDSIESTRVVQEMKNRMYFV